MRYEALNNIKTIKRVFKEFQNKANRIFFFFKGGQKVSIMQNEPNRVGKSYASWPIRVHTYISHPTLAFLR